MPLKFTSQPTVSFAASPHSVISTGARCAQWRNPLLYRGRRQPGPIRVAMPRSEEHPASCANRLFT